MTMNNIPKNEKFHVVFLGESGFPFGLAAIRKMTLISRALIKTGAEVTVINRKGKFDPDQPRELDLVGEFQGINYVYTSGTIYRPKGFIARNWQKLRGKIQELRYLIKLRNNNNLHAAIISSQSLLQVLSYRLFGFLIRIPLVYNYVEYVPAMQHRRGFLTRINDYLLDPWLVTKMEGAFPISEVLTENYKKIAPGKPFLKLPIICDFEEFNLPKNQPEEPYFLYCGALDYREVIDFILDSFDQLPDEPHVNLKLIVSGGTKEKYQQFHQDLQQYKKASRIKVFSDIPYSQLVDLYLNAQALLIPLRPTLQDAARFPFKIGEYLAAGNPIITTNYGEVKNYFKDGDTALIADSYETDAFAQKMEFVLNHPKEARAIGERGKKFGLLEFNYVSYGPKLRTFLQSLN